MEPTQQIRVVAADDDSGFRQMLKLLFDSTTDIQLVGEAAFGTDAVRLYKELQPDVVLMDINMPVMNGLDAIKAICQDFPQARIILFSAYLKPSTTQLALEGGAVGVLAKPIHLTELLNSIRHVHNGLTVDGRARSR
jgi:YesN/AraC family two-component response regulator